MQVKISIIIPTYNRAKLVLETVKSVYQQTFPNFEVIVIDDGSTDNTEDALKDYRELPNFHYFYKKNEGRSVARNFGMEKASGEFLMFLDSDDLLMPNALEVLWRKFENCPDSEVVGARSIDVYEDGHHTPSNTVKLPDEVCSQYLRIEKIRRFFFSQGTYIIKKTLARQLNGFKVGVETGEDLLFFFEYCDKAKVSVIKDIVLQIRRHSSNTTSYLIHEAIISISKEKFEELELNAQNFEPDLIKAMKIEWQFKLADYYYGLQRNSNAREHYLTAGKISPNLFFDPNFIKLILMTFVPHQITRKLKQRLNKMNASM